MTQESVKYFTSPFTGEQIFLRQIFWNRWQADHISWMCPFCKHQWSGHRRLKYEGKKPTRCPQCHRHIEAVERVRWCCWGKANAECSVGCCSVFRWRVSWHGNILPVRRTTDRTVEATEMIIVYPNAKMKASRHNWVYGETGFRVARKTCYGKLSAQSKLKFSTECVNCLSKQECARASVRGCLKPKTVSL